MSCLVRRRLLPVIGRLTHSKLVLAESCNAVPHLILTATQWYQWHVTMTCVWQLTTHALVLESILRPHVTVVLYQGGETERREDRHVTILQYNTTTLWGNYLNHLTWSWWGLLISVVLFYLLSLLQFLKFLHRCLVFTRNSHFSQITTKEIKQIITHLNDLLQIFHLSAGVQGGTYLNTEKCSIPLSHFWLGLTAEIPANK